MPDKHIDKHGGFGKDGHQRHSSQLIQFVPFWGLPLGIVRASFGLIDEWNHALAGAMSTAIPIADIGQKYLVIRLVPIRLRKRIPLPGRLKFCSTGELENA